MISVIIPCKNEPYLSTLIARIHREVKSPHTIHVQKEEGLSNAVMEGVRKSNGDVIAILDGDGSHNPQYIDLMASLLSRYDVVVGSRYTSAKMRGNSEDSAIKSLISVITCKAVNVLFKLKIKDPMSGFVVMKRRVFDKLRSLLKPVGLKFLLEILVKGKSLKVCEFPIFFEKRKMGVSKNGMLQALRTSAFISMLFAWSRIHA